MIELAEAQARLLALLAPLGAEEVALEAAHGRVLARPVGAGHDQPPFDASAMDGYAICGADARVGAALKVVGVSAAGRGFSGRLHGGQAVRIFTGAPLPEGADLVVMQEDVHRMGDIATLASAPASGANIRLAGCDFRAGEALSAPRLLRPADIALAAAMNLPSLPVHRRPDVALIATGDELVEPGSPLGPGQIVTSNSYGLAALVAEAGGQARRMPIARDSEEALHAAFDAAAGADIIVTIGGASVGEHDLVARVATARGLDMAFQKVALRPGKPVFAGRLGRSVLLGLPGNPVSALVCARLFLAPALRALTGQVALETPLQAPLATALPANGPRAHYMRARLEGGALSAFESQDSSLLGILSQARALIIRPANDPAREAGEPMNYLPL